MARRITQVGVASEQRFTADHLCPICNGHKDLASGISERCAGFVSTNGRLAYCSREEYAGDLEVNETTTPPTWAHLLDGDCQCNLVHGAHRNGSVALDGEPQVTVNGSQPRRIVATYDYVDEEGQRLFEVVRYEPKDFRQRHKVNGRWIWNIKDVRLVLYHLPEVIAAAANDEEVWIVEGEKDADRLSELGLVATCNPMGAGKWDDSYASVLQSARVAIIQDRDAHGRGQKHARDIARSLTGIARSVRVCEALTGKDVSDHLDAGRTIEELREIEIRLPVSRSGEVDGATFILDQPSEIPVIWGRADTQEVIWAEGESLLIAGPQGVGKSTVMQQVALRRAGIITTPFLDLPVTCDERPILYIAADRPSQIQRSFRRMASEEHREALAERLIVWRGPLPFMLSQEKPETFSDWVCDFGVGSVFIDSLKDIALDLKADETGSRVNAAFQETLARGVEVCRVAPPAQGTGE